MARTVRLLLAVCSLLLYSEAEGSSDKFVKKGDDVVLELRDVPEEFVSLSWAFNRSKNLVVFSHSGDPKVFSNKGRVEPSVTTYSVKLKNLQHADSGVYTARVIADTDKVLAEYRVTVQDPVSPVHLIVDSVSNSSESNNLTVTCSTQDSHHINSTFSCDTKTCRQEEGERSISTTAGASLRVYLSEGFIICNHSNHISWTQDNTTAEQFYVQNKIPNNATKTAIGSAVLVPVLLALFIGIFVKCRSKNTENTVYEVPQNIVRDSTPAQTPTENASPIVSTYATVTFHTAPFKSTESPNNSNPETIYAQVNKVTTSKHRTHSP